MDYNPSDELPAKHYSNKNTRRWCRGKEGVEHELLWEWSGGYLSHTHLNLVCQNCGKHRGWKRLSELFFERLNEYGLVKENIVCFKLKITSDVILDFINDKPNPQWWIMDPYDPDQDKERNDEDKRI